MSVECRSCGHGVPQGQFRCGKCGAAQTRDTFDDLNPVSEVVDEDPLLVRPAPLSEPPPPPVIPFEPLMRPLSPRPPPRESPRPPALESVIPRGTFASEEPVAALMGGAATARVLEPAPLPSTGEEESGPVVVQSGVRPKEVVVPAAVIQEPATAAVVPKCQQPPFLASEIMREALCPRAPGDRVLTLGLRLAAALGLIAGWMGVQSPAGVLVAVGALSLLGMSFLRVGYTARAAIAVAVAALSFSMVTLWRASIVAQEDDLVLALTVVSLSTALWLRAWHRGSWFARYLVASSLVPALGWAAWSGSGNLLSLDWSLQSWLPPLTWVVFFILCLLSLLAFMDKHTSGACDVWATCLLVWYGIYVIGREALLNDAGLDTLTALGLSEAVFAAPLSIALAQLFATLLGKQQRGQVGLLRQAA